MIPPGLWRSVLRTRRDAGFLAAGVLPHLALMPAWSWGVITAEAGNWPLALPTSVAVILLGVPVLTAVQRARYRVLLGMFLPRPAPAPEQQWSWAAAARRLRAPRTWGQLGYHLLLGPVLAVSELLVLMALPVGLAGVTCSAWAWELPVEVREEWFGATTQLPCYTLGVPVS